MKQKHKVFKVASFKKIFFPLHVYVYVYILLLRMKNTA